MTKEEALKAIEDFYARDKQDVEAFNNTWGHKGVEMQVGFLSGRVNDAISLIFIILKYLVENIPDREQPRHQQG